jgi:hypothetical protein
MEAARDRFVAFRHEALESALRHAPEHAAILRNGMCGKVALELKVQAGYCMACESKNFTLHAKKKEAEVVVLQLCGAFKLKVPLYVCNDCNEEFHMSPFDVDCFPSTADHALNLFRSGATGLVIWFDWSTLRSLVRMQLEFSPGTSEEGTIYLFIPRFYVLITH